MSEPDELDRALERYYAERGRPRRRAPGEQNPPPGRARFLRGARKPALLAITMGFGLLALNVHGALSGGIVWPRSTGLGIAASCMGVAMFAFPGSIDLPMFTLRPLPTREVFAGLAPHERRAWVLAGVVGVVSGAVAFMALRGG